MAVYVCVESEDDSPTGWDWGLAGDRELASRLADLPKTVWLDTDPDDPMDVAYERGFRPTDFDVWRKAEAEYDEPYNPGRFTSLIELLAANPTYWVRISW